MTKVLEEKVFQKVYPFTTENIGEYFKKLDLKNKDVLTVGSSLDQAFNAILLGAKNITVFDLNANTKEFYKLKRDMILSVPREELFSEIIKQRRISFDPDIFPKEAVMHINLYLRNDYYYNLLREKLEETQISIVYGDIFNIDSYLEKQKFDCLILSNILQYLEDFSKNKDPFPFLQKNFQKWKEYLNEDGIMQLLYLYSFKIEDDLKSSDYLSVYNLRKVKSALQGNELIIEYFRDSFNSNQDAIVTYHKKK